MCIMTNTNNAQLFLNELETTEVKYSIDRNNKLYLASKLPAEVGEMLPRELIPRPVLRLLKQYEDGTLRKESLGAPKYHDRIKTLRRYNLIPPVPRRSSAEKRAKNCEYLRQWRKKHAV